MPNSEDQAILTIVAVIVVLLFLGILFLVMVLYYSNKKVQQLKEKQFMKDTFEKQLLQSKIEIQEQTFHFISQEIHDNVGQVLSLAKVQLNIMDQQQELDKTILKDVKESVSKAMTELRDIAKCLSREWVQSFDLLEAITDEVKRLNNTGSLIATMNVKSSSCNRIEQYKLIIFRLIQESIQNILKHAKASKVNISVDVNSEKSFIIISDNGIGFDVATTLKKDNGLGLKNIINRTRLIGGEVNIQSDCGDGTAITIILPNHNA